MSSAAKSSSSVGTLCTFAEYPRTFPSLICAAYSKSSLTLCDIGCKDEPKCVPNCVLATEIPFFESGSFRLHDSTAIAYYLCTEQLKGGKDLKAQCEVLQWTHWTERKLTPLSEACTITQMGVKSKDPELTKKMAAEAREEVLHILKSLDQYLKTRTFFVGERISLADIVIFSSCFDLFRYVLIESKRKQLVNLERWFKTILNQPEVLQSLGSRASKFEFCTKEVTCVTPTEPPTAKIAECTLNGDETEESTPKSKNPMALLPKGTFSIDDFKRVYCNQDTETVAIPYFWEKFDPEHYSIWFAEYKYPEELKMTFMTSNLITGMFQRLDSLRNHAFASVCIFGEDNNNAIAGLWIWRGHQLAFELCEEWSVDYASYKWTKLDASKPETKKLVNGYLLWEPEDFQGKKFKEGKIFK